MQDELQVSVMPKWDRLVRRRAFLKGLGAAGAVLPVGALFAGDAAASDSRLTKGDADVLRFLTWAELIESDFWGQYRELGGADGGNAAYVAALQNIDGDMPQYISDNTDDEESHAAFLNAFLKLRGAEQVDLDRFRKLPSTKATGAQQKGRLTTLMNLTVDTSWYERYRGTENPDLGAKFGQALDIKNQPTIPISDTETPPNQPQPVPPATTAERRMQAIANSASFHFGMIEQGGSSLYTTMSLKVTSLEVLRIVVSIGGTEIDHFSLWHDKVAGPVSQPLAGVVDPVTGTTFPDFNSPPFGGENFQTNLILAEPCDFLIEGLPECSVIRPTNLELAGAQAAVRGLTNSNLFHGQTDEFFDFADRLAKAADAAHRQLYT